MTTTEAVDAVEALSTEEALATRDYARMKPNDALAHLNERLAAEVEYFERETGLVLASVKVTRDKEEDTLKGLKAHVR